jgi:hypothetical protein
VEHAGAFSTIAWESPKRLSHIPTASAVIYKFIKKKKEKNQRSLPINFHLKKALFLSRQWGSLYTAWLNFNNQGELISFVSNDRYNVDARKRLPWSTPLNGYTDIDGRMIPAYAETVYSYPTGDLTYGTFSFVSIEYNSKGIK